MAFLQKLEARLADEGEDCDVGEAALGSMQIVAVRQFRIADKDWFDAAPIPNVQRWLKTLTESALFKSVMEKYPLWKETGEEIDFFPDIFHQRLPTL